MRPHPLAALALLAAWFVVTGALVPARAQSMLGQPQALPPLAPVAVPPAPAITAAAPSAPVAPAAPAPAPPGLVQTTAPPATQDQTAAAAPAAPPVADIAPVIANVWVPASVARLGVLDKVDGSTSEVSIPVGGQSLVGDLQISVQSCDTRPPDQIPDTAIFLTVSPTGAASGPPVFRGWMVRSLPAAAVVGDAGETFRVIGCG